MERDSAANVGANSFTRRGLPRWRVGLTRRARTYCATRRKRLRAAELRRWIARSQGTLGRTQLAFMLTPEASPAGAPHGTPTVESDCRPSGYPWQAAKTPGQRFHRPRYRRGLLLGCDSRPPPGLGLPQAELADPPPPPAASRGGDAVAAAEDPSGGRPAGRLGAARPGPQGARPVLDDRRQAVGDRRLLHG